MHKIIIFLSILFISGCVSTYKPPQSGPTASIHFQLEKGLTSGPTVSMFEGAECFPSELGEYIGTLWKGNWTEPSTLEFTVKVPADRELAFEFFKRLKFSGEYVRPGEFCRQTFAFTPDNGKHYTFTYGNCDYIAIDTKKNQPLELKKTTGDCKNSYYLLLDP